MISRILQAAQRMREERPLIHCLTNHITINDCANVILAAGARPIMAEHSAEAAEITRTAAAVECNLGNISDQRMAAMRESAQEAEKLGLPITLDPVGVTCSTLRREFAAELMALGKPAVLRGNLSEIRLLAGAESHGSGIDAGTQDANNQNSLDEACSIVQGLAKRTGITVVASGAVDIASNGERTYCIYGGDEKMGSVTGTGCMCAALTAAYTAVADPLTAAVAGTAVLGAAGKRAAQQMEQEGFGIGTYHVRLLDEVWKLRGNALKQALHVELWK